MKIWFHIIKTGSATPEQRIFILEYLINYQRIFIKYTQKNK